MSAPDTMMPLLTAPWSGRFGEQLPTVPLPGIRREAIANLESHWTGTMTPEMRQLLQFSCGLSQTPFGSVDFTGRWYPEEPLSVFRPSLTLAIDDQGRRWIAEVGRRRGLPGPVWCVLAKPEVAMLIDRNLADFVVRLHSNQRRDAMLQWLTVLNIRARKIWASRHARAITLPAAFSRMRDCQDSPYSRNLNAFLGVTCIEDGLVGKSKPGLRKGDKVTSILPAANYDPAAFPNPREVNFHRHRKPVLAFGGGVHSCMGAHLARLELRISITEFLRRIPDFRVADGTRIEYWPGGVVGPKAVPLSW